MIYKPSNQTTQYATDSDCILTVNQLEAEVQIWNWLQMIYIHRN